MNAPRDAELPLAGGNASDGVVRIGATVRKPWLDSMPRTLAYMDALRERGIDVPRAHGRDERGRLVLDFVPGTMALGLAPLPDEMVERVGALVRGMHDAAADLPVPEDWPVLLPAPHADLICHNDLATWNLVVDGDRLTFIDFDGAGPSSRIWDLAYAAVSFAHAVPGASPAAAASRLRSLLEGYGADAAMRRELPAMMARRARAMAEMLRRAHTEGIEPWGSMHADGHGEHWRLTVAWIEEHQELLARAISAEPS